MVELLAAIASCNCIQICFDIESIKKYYACQSPTQHYFKIRIACWITSYWCSSVDSIIKELFQVRERGTRRISLDRFLCRTDSMNSKTSISVGVIGVPNVGKSSVINSLCRNPTATKVGSEAGITRILQEINLDGGIRLIDSPGVISEGNELDAEMILRNSVKVSILNVMIVIWESMSFTYQCWDSRDNDET